MISFFELFKAGVGPSSSRDIIFDFERVFAEHSNAMTLAAFDRGGQLLEQETWYSIGGGFVVREGDRTDAQGPSVEGLPGVLKVQRRANGLLERLRDRTLVNARAPHESLEVVKVYAIATNEENAAGVRIVTDPTNGAAGVIPAVLKYYRDHCLAESEAGIRDFQLTATAIGSLCK